MAKNTKQIALIQHRRGQLSELPTELNEGEFGLALDTNQLFIGNSNNEKLSKRIEENMFPYGNIEILTEFSDNLQKIKYTYKSNTDVIARLPIIIYGSASNPILPANSSIIINDVEIYFKNNSNIQTIVDTINSESKEVKAFIFNNSYLGLISTGTEIYIEDGIVNKTSNIKILGISEDSFYAKTSEILPERTLQETLDDYCSIKSFGAKGDGIVDDSENIYNAILAINKAGAEPQYYRTIFFPAGVYKISSKSIPMPTGIHLKGEGIGRTVIKSQDIYNSLVMSMDDNFNYLNSISFGKNSSQIKYVYIEDMTFDISSDTISSLLSLGSSDYVVFKNVEFIGNSNSNIVHITNSSYLNTSFNILFENCIFNNAYNGIISSSNIEHIVIKNCVFKNIAREAILFNNSDYKIINSIIDGNIFTNCGNVSNIIISLAKNCEYVSVINNKFDENVSNGSSAIKPYISNSELTYTDILDPSTDTKKLLQFKFTQPLWEYIDYLMNPNGEYILKSVYETIIKDGQEIIPPLQNGLIINQGDETNNNTITIDSSLLYGNINVNSGAYGNINIGKNNTNSSFNDYNINKQYQINDIVQNVENEKYVLYKCITPNTGESLSNETYWQKIGEYNPYIIFHKPIDINDNSITNNGLNGDINFIVKDSGILTITNDSENGIDDYNNKISSVLNAIPTVKYVNTTAQATVNKIINFNTIYDGHTNKYDLVYFDPMKYGDIVNLDKLSINVRRPYYSIQDGIDNALNWKHGIRYYIGDVIYDASEEKYFVCYEDHFSTEEEINYQHWFPVAKQNICTDGETRYLNDVKYIAIIATNDIDNPARLLFEKDEVDISKRDIKSSYYPNWQAKKVYNINDKVLYNNRYWKCLKQHTSSDAYDLHNIELWTIINEEGYNYIYEFDRNITPIDFKSEIEIDTIKTENDVTIDDTGYIEDFNKIYNYSGYRLYLEFLDKDMNLMPIAIFNNVGDDAENDERMQVNPSGYLSINIKYIRGENNEN